MHITAAKDAQKTLLFPLDHVVASYGACVVTVEICDLLLVTLRMHIEQHLCAFKEVFVPQQRDLGQETDSGSSRSRLTIALRLRTMEVLRLPRSSVGLRPLRAAHRNGSCLVGI